MIPQLDQTIETPSTNPEPATDRPGILVIDDDHALRAVLCDVLNHAGFDTAGASDGMMGLKLYAEKKYDLVISDMLMPNCDGVELIAALRKKNPEVSIIAISGGGLIAAESYLRIASAFGVKAVLRKPFKMQSLVDLVKLELG